MGKRHHVSTPPAAFVSIGDEDGPPSIRWGLDGAEFGGLIAARGLHFSYANTMSWRRSSAHQVGSPSREDPS
jgi:hypothetical protein